MGIAHTPSTKKQSLCTRFENALVAPKSRRFQLSNGFNCFRRRYNYLDSDLSNLRVHESSIFDHILDLFRLWRGQVGCHLVMVSGWTGTGTQSSEAQGAVSRMFRSPATLDRLSATSRTSFDMRGT